MIINKKILLNAIKEVNKIGEVKLLPILQTIYLHQNQKLQQLTLIHTTLDITAIISIPAKIKKITTDIIINNKLFNQIINNSPEEIKIELEDNKLNIGKYKIHTYEIKDFPNIFYKKIKKQELKVKKNYSSFIPFVDIGKSAEIIFQSIYFGKNFVCATDSKRMIIDETKWETNFYLNPILAKENIKTILTYEKDICIITDKGTKFIQKGITDKYPDILSYIPKYTKYVKFNKKKFINLVENILPLTTDDELLLRVQIEKDKIVINKKSKLGEFIDSIEAKSTVSLEIAFNPYYLLATLNAIPEDIVIFNLPLSADKPILYSNKGRKIVLLPMNL